MQFEDNYNYHILLVNCQSLEWLRFHILQKIYCTVAIFNGNLNHEKLSMCLLIV